jgi:hypothetical protein
MLNRALFNQVLFNGRVTAAIALAGSIAVSSTTAAGVEVATFLNGSSAVSAVTQAQVSKTDNLAAVVSATSLSLCDVRLSMPLESGVSASASIAGVPVIAKPLDGLSDLGGLAVTGILEGSLEGITPLNSQLQCSSSIVPASVAVSKTLSGAASVSSSTHGAVSKTAAFGAGVIASATAIVDAQVAINCSATPNITAASVASLNLALPISASINASVAINSTLSNSVGLSGSIQTQATTSAVADAQAYTILNCAITATATASNTAFNKESPLSASGVSEISAGGNLLLAIFIEGSSGCAASVIGLVDHVVILDAVAQLTSTATGGLQNDSFLGSAVFGPVTATADIYLEKSVTANAQVTTTTEAAILKESVLGATLYGSGTVAGNLENLAKLSAAIDTQLTAVGSLEKSAELGIAILGPVAATAALDITKNISTNSVFTGEASAEVGLTTLLAGSFASSAQASADLSVLLVVYYGDVTAKVEARQVVAKVVIQNDIQVKAEINYIQTAEISYLQVA